MKLAWLIPQEKKFFDLLEQYAGLARECSNLLLEMFNQFDMRETKWREIKDVEEKGDDLLHKIVDELNTTFITPIDREDIYALASKMDDILDFTEGVAERVMLFKMGPPPKHLVDITDVLYQATKELAIAMPILRNLGKLQELKKHYVEVHRLENRGDDLSRQALAELFETKDPIEIIKLKEIYEFVEIAIDKCEDVAVILENLVVKHM